MNARFAVFPKLAGTSPASMLVSEPLSYSVGSILCDAMMARQKREEGKMTVDQGCVIRRLLTDDCYTLTAVFGSVLPRAVTAFGQLRSSIHARRI